MQFCPVNNCPVWDNCSWVKIRWVAPNHLFSLISSYSHLVTLLWNRPELCSSCGYLWSYASIFASPSFAPAPCTSFFNCYLLLIYPLELSSDIIALGFPPCPPLPSLELESGLQNILHFPISSYLQCPFICSHSTVSPKGQDRVASFCYF